MRVKGAAIQQFMLGAALIAALCWNLAQASEIKALQLKTGATGTRAELGLDQSVNYQVISLANPDRLVVDLPGVALKTSLSMPAAAGVVKSVRVGHPIAGTTRIVFDLTSSIVALKPRFEPSATGVQLVLEWPGDNASSVVGMGLPQSKDEARSPRAEVAPPVSNPTVDASAATSRLIAELPNNNSTPLSALPPQSQPTRNQSLQRAVPTTITLPGTIATGIPTRVATGVPAPAPDSSGQLPQMRQPSSTTRNRAIGSAMRPLVIAIDAGHGGQDPGAIGPSGTYEKNVVLAISRELARQVNATPGMRAYLVRDSDVYVERPQRSRRARQAKADMFVSIHADAAPNRSAYGSSVYTLSLRGASSQHARWLADRENTSDLVGGVRLEKDTLSSVLLDLAQSGHMKASQDAAEQVLDGLRGLGKVHKPQVEYANFEVLRNADMPAMLVETGFISNVDEEKRLLDGAHQRRVAGVVLQGINEYFTLQPPPGTLYAARAQNASPSSSNGTL